MAHPSSYEHAWGEFISFGRHRVTLMSDGQRFARRLIVLTDGGLPETDSEDSAGAVDPFGAPLYALVSIVAYLWFRRVLRAAVKAQA